jgi:acyl-CoA synthetase (AMP-forming)/AMP-acid ligase II
VIAGSDIAGTVESLGPGVPAGWLGKRVLIDPVMRDSDRAVTRGQRAVRIGILAENRLEFIACYCGIMRMGAVAVPVNHKLPRATIEHIVRHSGIELAFSDAPRRSQLPNSVPVIDFDATGATGFDAFLDAGPTNTWLPADGARAARRGDDDLAEILYTSGSTGLPKGVPLGHHGQLWAIGHYLEPLPVSAPQETTIIVAPLYHMNGLFNITVALACMAAIVMRAPLSRLAARARVTL